MVYAVLLGMTFMGACASYFLKKASGDLSIMRLITNKHLYLGGGLYVVAALLNIYVLRFLDYSVVLPLTSFTYIWTMILSYYLLGEKISKKKIVGIVLILTGAVMVAV